MIARLRAAVPRAGGARRMARPCEDDAVSIPALRPLPAFAVQDGARQVIALRDPSGIMTDVLAIAPEVYFVASHFDGKSDAKAVADAVSAQMKTKVSVEVVEKIARLFGERLLLDDDAFRARDL